MLTLNCNPIMRFTWFAVNSRRDATQHSSCPSTVCPRTHSFSWSLNAFGTGSEREHSTALLPGKLGRVVYLWRLFRVYTRVRGQSVRACSSSSLLAVRPSGCASSVIIGECSPYAAGPHRPNWASENAFIWDIEGESSIIVFGLSVIVCERVCELGAFSRLPSRFFHANSISEEAATYIDHNQNGKYVANVCAWQTDLLSMFIC